MNKAAIRPVVTNTTSFDLLQGAILRSNEGSERNGLAPRVKEWLEKSRASTAFMGLKHVEFRDGLLEQIPVQDGWADVAISNGVINLCADKRQTFSELWRIMRPGGRLQFGDIANGKPVPAGALRDIDLWTG